MFTYFYPVLSFCWMTPHSSRKWPSINNVSFCPWNITTSSWSIVIRYEASYFRFRPKSHSSEITRAMQLVETIQHQVRQLCFKHDIQTVSDVFQKNRPFRWKPRRKTLLVMISYVSAMYISILEQVLEFPDAVIVGFLSSGCVSACYRTLFRFFAFSKLSESTRFLSPLKHKFQHCHHVIEALHGNLWEIVEIVFNGFRYDSFRSTKGCCAQCWKQVFVLARQEGRT